MAESKPSQNTNDLTECGIDTVQRLEDVICNQHRKGVGMWKLERSFGIEGEEKLKDARGVAITQEGNIAVADTGDSSIKLYSKDGQFKLSVKVGDRPWNVVVSSDGDLFVTNDTCYVTVYDEKGNQTNLIYTKSPDVTSSADQDTRHRGLVMDNNGTLLVGGYKPGTGYISKHRLDGTHIMTFSVKCSPWHIAITSDDNIVVSNGYSCVIDMYTENGLHLRTLNLPQRPSWNPWGTCCTSANDILMANLSYSGAIYCYSGETGAYIGCLTEDVDCPVDLALMDDEETLIVVELHGIKIFKLQ